MMRTFAIAALTVILAACGSTAHNAPSANGAPLKDTVGKPYSQVIRQRPDLGSLVEHETLDSGYQIMKHVGGLDTASSSYAGIYGKQEQQARVVYLLVDDRGIVKDWATESYMAGSANCWVGICGNQRYRPMPAEDLDRLVKTSSGATIAAWRSGH